MDNKRRKIYSQNFLHSPKLIAKLLDFTAFDKHDTAIEIGPGKGIITKELLARCKKVIAVEIDHEWYTYLQQKYPDKNLLLFQQDILQFHLPQNPYKVFANLPFAIEGQIIRKLIDAKNPPEDCYLVINVKLANRLAAQYKENLFSILHKPWFDFSIPYHFKPTDFTPIPNVDAALFCFTKKQQPLIQLAEKKQYEQFIQLGFSHGLPTYTNLKNHYGKDKVLRALQNLSLRKDTKPSYLTLEQWIMLYKILN